MSYIIVGAKGKLGTKVCSLLKKFQKTIIEIDKDDDLNIVLLKDITAILDVSSAENSINTLDFAEKHNIPIVIGCTGHTEEQLKKIKNASIKIPVLLSYNFSIGITALKKALRNILSFEPKAAYITELHHSAKKDAPSGTAKDLAEIIDNSSAHLDGVFCKRQGEFIGLHEVELYFNNEVIKISHNALSRDCFASGAVHALEKISSLKPGLYKMEDIFS